MADHDARWALGPDPSDPRLLYPGISANIQYLHKSDPEVALFGSCGQSQMQSVEHCIRE